MEEYYKYYKELLISSKSVSGQGKRQLFAFIFHIKSKIEIKGYYIMDEMDEKWVSLSPLCQISSANSNLSSVKNKYFDINSDIQLNFFNLGGIKLDSELQIPIILLEIISENHKKGTPRKFLFKGNGEKIDIKLPYERVKSFDYF